MRRDIQGLRAIAVVIVVLNHMLGWPSGGFAGVDVFFVLSGFLITGLLLREYERTGQISFVGFYRRRIKRIVPAATLTLIVVVALGFLILTRQRAISTAWDALFAFVFVSNWNFVARGVDYFQQGGAVSPVQHFWSLSVEEQFYLVWPWLLLGLLILFARLGSMSVVKMRAIAGITIGVVTAASFSYATLVSAASPTISYFSSFSRVWELGVGALLAIVAPLLVEQRPLQRTVLAYVGLAGIAVSCFVVSDSSQWPAPWGLLPVCSTALALASGVGVEARYIAPLTNPVSVYIGDISYSLYLWHFPIIIFGKALFPTGGIWTYVGIMIAGFGIAIAAFHVVEKPLWKSPLWSGRQRSRRVWRGWILEFGPQMRLGGLAGLSVATAVLCALALVRSAPVYSGTAASVPISSTVATATPSSGSDDRPATAKIEAEVLDALHATSWPAQLTPSIDEAGPTSRAQQWVRDGCLGPWPGSFSATAAAAERCVYGDTSARKTLVVWGDSYAISWVPGLLQGLGGRGWRVVVYTSALCPAADVTVQAAEGGAALRYCDEFRHWVVEQIKRLSPEYVVMSQSGVLHPLSGATGDRATAEFLDGVSATLDEVKGLAEHVAIVDSPPVTVSIEDCYVVGGQPSDCVRRVDQQHQGLTASVSHLVESRGDPSIKFVAVDRLFCAQEQCPAQVDGILVRADSGHPTDAYSRHIGAALVELLGIGE